MKTWIPLFWCALLGLSLLASPAAAQAQSAVKARLSTGLARVGEVAHIRVTVDNADSARLLEVPEIEGVKVGRPSPPMRSSYSEFRGGRMIKSTSVQWTIPLEPQLAGEFEIPNLRVEVDGRERSVAVTPGALKVVKDLEAAKLGLFEIPERPQRIYEGQPFSLRMRIGWADRLQVKKISLLLPWWGSQNGVLDVEGPGFSARTQNVLRLLINGRYETPFEALGITDIGGEDYRVFEHEASMVATRAGRLEYPTSTFVFAEELERSGSPFRASRMREYYATLDPFVIEVLPVPEAGRPFEWGGAVGTLVADRRVNHRDVAAGETIQLEVTWAGMANTEFFDLPDLKRIEAFEGFRVLGVDDTHLGMERRAVYELVPLSSEVTEIPAVPLWIFNTETESYEELLTEPVAIRVREGEALDLTSAFGGEGVEESKRDLRDLHDVPISSFVASGTAASVSTGPRSAWIVGLFLITLAGWLALRTYVRRHGDPGSARSRARRAAMRQLQRHLARAQSPAELTQAVVTFLGVRSDESPEAWIGRDVVAWAEEQSAPKPAIERAQAMHTVLQKLDEANYSNETTPPDAQTIVNAARGMTQGGLL